MLPTEFDPSDVFTRVRPPHHIWHREGGDPPDLAYAGRRELYDLVDVDLVQRALELGEVRGWGVQKFLFNKKLFGPKSLKKKLLG